MNLEEPIAKRLCVYVCSVAPRFTIDERLVSSVLTPLPGTTVKLSCSAVARPPPEVTWYKDGGELSHDESLLLPEVTPSDSGRYDCSVRNRAGSINRTFVVNVDGEQRCFWSLYKLSDVVEKRKINSLSPYLCLEVLSVLQSVKPISKWTAKKQNLRILSKKIFAIIFYRCLRCFYAVGWATGKASGL